MRDRCGQITHKKDKKNIVVFLVGSLRRFVAKVYKRFQEWRPKKKKGKNIFNMKRPFLCTHIKKNREKFDFGLEKYRDTDLSRYFVTEFF